MSEHRNPHFWPRDSFSRRSYADILSAYCERCLLIFYNTFINKYHNTNQQPTYLYIQPLKGLSMDAGQ
jgi:hypothetical protein